MAYSSVSYYSNPASFQQIFCSISGEKMVSDGVYFESKVSMICLLHKLRNLLYAVEGQHVRRCVAESIRMIFSSTMHILRLEI